MAEAAATSSRGGRPPRDRTRHKYIPRLEVLACQRIEQIAIRSRLSPGIVAEVAISHAHGYQSPWTPTIADLNGVDGESLVRVVQAVPGEEYWPAGAVRKFGFYLDGEVASQVNVRCDELGLVYAHYLRRILHQLAGVDLATLREQQVVQGDLFDARGAAS